jgi:thiol-disulfide isomerase/thioredoxin
MRSSTRWTLAVLAILGALAVALALELADGPVEPHTATAPDRRTHRDADTPEALAGPRQRAGLPPCPIGGPGPGPEKLRGIVVECAADGSEVDAAEVVADRTVVLNLWAYWCGPCAEELPALQEYQRRVGDAVKVITVHQDENETAALIRMAELGVRLPVLQDGRRSIAAALAVPNIMPATVVLRRDGSVARVLPQPFTSADEVAAAVDAVVR